MLLDDNDLTELDQELFANLTISKTLILDGNHIKVLPAGIFAPLINLEWLFLSKNIFSTLNYSWLGDGVKKLTEIDFYDNNISFIDEKIFNKNPELMKIVGHNNPCTTISVNKEFIREKPKIKAYLANCFIKSLNVTSNSAFERNIYVKN